MLKKVVIYKDGKDVGGIENRRNWWLDPSFENSFSYFDLDSIYTDEYFKEDHVNGENAKEYAKTVLSVFNKITPIQKVIEFGSGAGWFTQAFANAGVHVSGIEGTAIGYRKCREREMNPFCFFFTQLDLRFPVNIKRKADLALCTEVAEHIEIPFSGTLIRSLTNSSDLILFSSTGPSASGDSHYHHCNEQPFIFWQNLFAFFDFDVIELPEAIYSKLCDRGRYIFFNPKVFKKEQIQEKL